MKALTVAQPWASLIVAGVKTIETRPMPPNGPMCPAGVRGLPGLAVEPGERIAIHAAADPAPFWDIWDRHVVQRLRQLPDFDPDPDPLDGTSGLPLGAIVGTAVVAEVLPIIDLEFGWQCDTDTPERALVTDGTHAELLGPGSAGDDVTDQLPLGDYRPGRWAWVLTDAHRCQDRCPNPDCERGVIDLTQPHRGGPWQWQLCPVCVAPGRQAPGDGRCDPIPTRGAQGVWEWPLSRRSLEVVAEKSVSELGTGGAPMTATELTRSDADENLDACRVRCHVCGARVYVGETAHDVEPGDDGAERFACAEHCETCR